MKKINAAVVGYGNIGKYAAEAVQAAPDFTLSGIVRRAAGDPINGIPVVTDIKELGKVDVAILCAPTRQTEQYAQEYLAMGIHTVDSFDIHGQIWDLKCRLDKIGRENGTVSVISAGWDPGSDSVIRTLLLAMAPKGLTYTNFGPGMSMGHSTAAKSIEGVREALSMTIPMGTGIHKRMLYIELEEGAVFADVEKRILADDYFAHDETHVIAVDSVDVLKDMGHGVNITRKGVSGITQNQMFEYNMRINNPALTAQILVGCARAAMKQQPGCYTMIELPPIDLVYGERENLIKNLV